MTSEYRYFLTYSGVRLPLNLVQPLEPGELDNRNTYFRARYDPEGRVTGIEKLVYGEVELAHARVTIGDEETEIAFDESGAPMRG